MTDDETITETVVVYFPPGKGDKTRKAQNLADAQRICAELAGCAPLIQQRTITYAPWVIVENSVAPSER